jgi:hypothetical protein
LGKSDGFTPKKPRHLSKMREYKPFVRECKPFVREYKPFVREHKPLVREHKPLVREHKPLVREHKPLVREHKPLVREHKPLVREYKPLVRENKLRVHVQKPVGKRPICELSVEKGRPPGQLQREDLIQLAGDLAEARGGSTPLGVQAGSAMAQP